MPLAADLILYGGNLVTLDRANPRATAIAVRRGVIERVGSLADCLAVGGPETRRIDLHGKTVVPVFHDCHLHLLWYGKHLIGRADLVGVATIDELLGRLGERAARSEGWIEGHGFDQEKLAERRFPTRDELDRVSRERPILVTRICGHAAVANSAAIGLLADAERSAGDADSGLYTETAIGPLRAWVPPMDDATQEAALRAAMAVALRTGITSVQTMLDAADQMKVYARLRRSLGRLPLRVVAMPPESAATTLSDHGVTTGFGDAWLRFGGCKFFADGSLGARTAYLTTPYHDMMGERGTRIYEPDVLRRRFREVHEQGWQIVVHAIGDAALDDALDGIEHALAGGSNAGPRHRVEHASVCRPDQVRRLAKLGVYVAVQPQFVTSDVWTGERVGPDREDWCYPFASLLTAGVPVGLSSDCPVEALDARECLAAAVGRAAWSSGERLDAYEGLRAYCLGSAACGHREAEVGSLEVGKLADLVALSGDPSLADAPTLRGLKVEEVYVNGELAQVGGVVS